MPRLRKATWALVVWTVVVAFWLVSNARGIGDCAGQTNNDLAVCQIGRSLGLEYGLPLIVAVALVGYVVLGAIWLISRPQRARP